MKRLYRIGLALALVVGLVGSVQAAGRLKLATTTSTENSGLLKYLHPVFEKKYGVRIDTIAVGTGKALRLGANGDVDVVLVHARAAEDKFVADGNGVNRRDVMYNDFVIVGPAKDPAGVGGMRDAVAALKKIAAKKVSWFSRGDDSGTDKKEKALWKVAGMKPKGAWYKALGQGMGRTLIAADEKNGYTLSDRGTYLAMSSSKKIQLKVLVQGDKRLFNPYGVIAVNPKKHPNANYNLAMKYITFLTSPEGQKLIGAYRKNGKQLFHPDAGVSN